MLTLHAAQDSREDSPNSQMNVPLVQGSLSPPLQKYPGSHRTCALWVIFEGSMDAFVLQFSVDKEHAAHVLEVVKGTNDLVVKCWTVFAGVTRTKG